MVLLYIITLSIQVHFSLVETIPDNFSLLLIYRSSILLKVPLSFACGVKHKSLGFFFWYVAWTVSASFPDLRKGTCAQKLV